MSTIAQGNPLYFPAGTLPLREVTAGAGAVVAIPGQVPHGVAAGAEGATAVDAWSPVR